MLTIFFNPFGRLRSGWRLSIFLLGFIILSISWGSSLRTLHGLVSSYWSIPHPALVLEIVFRGGLLLIALGFGFVCAHFLEELPWRSLGASFQKGWFRDLLIGAAVGFGALVVAVAIATLGRGLKFSVYHIDWTATLGSMIGSAVMLFVAAFAEEAMFRGYALQTLSRAKLAWLGVLLTLALFGIAHLTNPNVVPGVTFANTALAGLWLAVAYLRTRSLWLPLGVHWAWNWALGWFFGLPISGLSLVSYPLLKASDNGPFWLTGGNYGIEGGLACTIALALCTLFLWRTSLVSADPELKKLTSEENPVTDPSVLSIRPASDHA
jgi:membrane protease YdiL (CAAX protease family)